MYNWMPVVESFLKRLIEHGFELIRVNDGEENIHINSSNFISDDSYPKNLIKHVAELICAVDESFLYVLNKNNEKRAIRIVLGNGPHEIACDYTVDEGIEKVVEEHWNEWEYRNTPTIER